MKITIKLFATFRDGRFLVSEREVADSTRVADVAAALDIPEKAIGIVLIDGRHCRDLATPLHDGASLSLFPLVGGG